jgi:hypothetical protein
MALNRQIRNIVISQITPQINRGKQWLMKEVKKKLLEQQQKLPTAKSIQEDLKVDVNEETCSEKGMEKWNEKYDEINDILVTAKNILEGSLEQFDKYLDKLGKLVEGVEGCSEETGSEDQPAGPLGKIQRILCKIEPIMEILRIIVALAPLLLLTFTAMFSNATAEDKITSSRDNARKAILGYANLIIAIPPMIQNIIDMALLTYNKMLAFRERVAGIRDQAVSMAVYLQSLRNQHELNCNNFLAAQSDTDDFDGFDNGDTDTQDTDDYDNDNNNNDGNNWVGDPTRGFATYDDAITWYNDHYQNILQTLLSQNNLVAVERLVKLDAQFREQYNLSFTQVNISPNQLQ